jgi:hypothetical protein
MISRLPNMPENILAFKATGEVTAEDYEKVLMPAVETVLKKYRKIRMFYELGPEFRGFTAGAMWDDAKVGIRHLSAWDKVALVTDVHWLRNMIRCLAFMIPGTVKVFGTKDGEAARNWIIY